MKIIQEGNLKEFMDVSFDRVRATGSLSAWQRQLYNYITVKLASVFLDKIFAKVNEQIEKIVPDDADKEEIKTTVKKAFLDYIDSVF
jgi:hypothetical protein